MSEKREYTKEVFNLIFSNDSCVSVKNLKEILLKNNISKLYKYRSNSERDIDNLKNNLLVAQKPYMFNDAFEFYYQLNYEEIKSKFYYNKDNPFLLSPEENYDYIKKQLDKEIMDYNVCSFSENNKSLLMWGHYANNHKGFCVEYDIFEIMKKYSLISPVIYSNKITKYYGGNITMKVLGKVLCTKSLEWEYEEEWRLFENFDCDTKIIEMPKPKTIYLGCKSDEYLEREMKNFCLENEIKLVKCNRNRFEYKLDFEEINLK